MTSKDTPLSASAALEIGAFRPRGFLCRAAWVQLEPGMRQVKHGRPASVAGTLVRTRRAAVTC